MRKKNCEIIVGIATKFNQQVQRPIIRLLKQSSPINQILLFDTFIRILVVTTRDYYN